MNTEKKTLRMQERLYAFVAITLGITPRAIQIIGYIALVAIPQKMLSTGRFLENGVRYERQKEKEYV